MGIFSWHTWTQESDENHVAVSTYLFHFVIIFEWVLAFAHLAIFDRIFVSWSMLIVIINLCFNFHAIVWQKILHSLSGSPGAMFAYIGELHNSQHRTSAIMYASAIHGVVSIALPGFAWLIINQEWQFYMPIFCYIYKPWRFYMVMSTIFTFIWYTALCFLPESPKFVLGTGNQQKAIDILNQIHQWNCGKHVEPLKISALYDETASENKSRIKSNSVFSSVWAQTVPLFKRPHLKTTFLVGTIQFGMFAGANGLFLWFPNIMNRIAVNEMEHPGERIQMFEIVYRTRLNITYTPTDPIFSPQVRITKYFFDICYT